MLDNPSEDEEGRSYQDLDEGSTLRGVRPPKRSAAGVETRASQSDDAPRAVFCQAWEQ